MCRTHVTDAGRSRHADDLALVARAAKGEERAQRTVVQRMTAVFRARAVYVKRRAPWIASHEDDLLQRFQMYLFAEDGRRLSGWSGEASFEGWIGVIATRFLLRQAGRLRPDKEVDPESVAEPRDSGDSPETRAIRSSTAGAVQDALRDLSDQDRTLLALLFEQDVPAHAAGKLLGISPSGVRMRKSRLLEKLAKKLRHLKEEDSP